MIEPAIAACRARRHRRRGAVPGRHAVRARLARRVRRRHRLLPRPGADPGQAAGVRQGRQRHARACRSSGRRSITAPPSTSPARNVADHGQPGRSRAAGREAGRRARRDRRGGGARRPAVSAKDAREKSRPEEGRAHHRREPQGPPRLPPPRDVRGRHGAGRHRGEGDPRGAGQPARQLRAGSRAARSTSTTSTSARTAAAATPTTSRSARASCSCTGRRSGSSSARRPSAA